jgi:hypothetical protein
MFADTYCGNPEHLPPKIEARVLPGGAVPHGSARPFFIEEESPDGVAHFISASTPA